MLFFIFFFNQSCLTIINAGQNLSPFIVQMHGYNDNTRCIYFELMEQSLDANKINRRREKYHVAQIREMVYRTLCGLKAIHDSGRNHSDLHLGNILVGRDGLTYIADLGLSRQIGTVYMEPAGARCSQHRCTRNDTRSTCCITQFGLL